MFAEWAEEDIKGPPHKQIMHELTDYQERADISMMTRFNNYYEFNEYTITTKEKKITFIINLESYKNFYITFGLDLLTNTNKNYYECVIYSYAVSNAIQGNSSSYYYYDFTNDSINILTYELRKWFDDFRNIIQKKKKQHKIHHIRWDNIFLPHEIERSGVFGGEHKIITFKCCYNLSDEKKINDFFDTKFTKLTEPDVQNDQILEEEQQSEKCFGCTVSGGKLRKRKNNKTYNKSKSHNRRRRRTHRRK
jgi:hypothetical protein